MRHRLLMLLLLVPVVLALLAPVAAAAPGDPVVPAVPAIPKLQIGPGDGTPTDSVNSLQLLILLTVLSLAPSILVLMTAFTRIVIVLAFTRSALGTQQMPPNQVLIGLAIFLTFFVMAPTFKTVNDQALQPYLKNQMTQSQFLDAAASPLKDFMLRQTRAQDLNLFVDLSGITKPSKQNDVPTYVVVPAFAISELKTAFQMGFVLFIPFLVIDLVVSSTLTSMGMMMLPPVVVSLPFKILLFVLVDGWHLVVQSLVTSFR